MAFKVFLHPFFYFYNRVRLVSMLVVAQNVGVQGTTVGSDNVGPDRKRIARPKPQFTLVKKVSCQYGGLCPRVSKRCDRSTVW